MRITLQCLGALVALTSQHHAFAQVSLQPLGLLPDGSASTMADMSSDGSTIVTSRNGIAYKWRDGSWSALNTTPLNSLNVRGVSGNGNTVIASVFDAAHNYGSSIAWRADAGNNFQYVLQNTLESTRQYIPQFADDTGNRVVGIREGTPSYWTVSDWNGSQYLQTLNAFPSQQRFLPISESGDYKVWSGLSDDGQTGFAHYDDGMFGTEKRFGQQPVTGFAPPANLPPTYDFSRMLAVSTDCSVSYIQYQASSQVYIVRWSQNTGSSVLAVDALTFNLSGEADRAGDILAGGTQIYVHSQGSVSSVANFLTNRGVDISGWTNLQCAEVDREGLTFAGTGTHEFAPGQFRNEVWRVTIPAPGVVAFLATGLIFSPRRRRCVS